MPEFYLNKQAECVYELEWEQKAAPHFNSISQQVLRDYFSLRKGGLLLSARNTIRHKFKSSMPLRRAWILRITSVRFSDPSSLER